MVFADAIKISATDKINIDKLWLYSCKYTTYCVMSNYEKNNKKIKKKVLTWGKPCDNIYLADARESEQQRPDKRSEKLDN